MKAIERIWSWKPWQTCVLGVLLSMSWCEVVRAVGPAPAWKSPNFIEFSSYDNQRGDRFLAFDHYGVPSAVTVNSVGSVIFARQVDGAGWYYRGVGGLNAKHVSLAFDRRELPGIAYGDDNGLNYTYFSPATMSFQTNLVDDTAVSGRDWTLGTGIAFDVYGRPAIAASVDDSSFGDLYYAYDSNLDGVLSSADTVEVATVLSEQFLSLVFDRQNRPVTANRFLLDGTQGDLNVWVKDPLVGWGVGFFGFFSNAEEGTPDAVTGSIAIDPTDGLPAVAWTHWTGAVSELQYAKWNQLENDWDQTLVTSDGVNQMGNESLAFDPGDGRPAISYGDDSGNVNFAWFDGAAWNTQIAESTGTAFAPRTSLAFNEFGHGFPAIAYITNNGFGTGSLQFIVDPPRAVPEPSALVLCCVGGAFFVIRRRRPIGRPGRLRFGEA